MIGPQKKSVIRFVKWLKIQAFNAAIVVAVVAVFLIAAISTFAWPPRRPGSEDAMIWTAAFAAIGTLAAVWAALRNAKEASRSADVALQIAKENQDQNELLRHEAARPVISVRGTWARILNPPPASDIGHLRLWVSHIEGLTGFGIYIVLLPQQPGLPFTLHSGSTLRPQSSLTSYIGADPVSGPGVIRYNGKSDLFGISTMWWIVCRIQDLYGWWWEQRSQLIQFVPGSLTVPSEGWALTITMSQPVRVDGPLIGELKSAV